MRILFVTPYLPSPPRFGGQRRLHGLMTELSREGHELSVLSIVKDEDVGHGSVAATGKYVRHVHPVDDDRAGLSDQSKRLLQLRSLASPSSFERLHYTSSRAIPPALRDALRARDYEAVVFEFVYMAFFLSPEVRRLAGRAAVILDEHNVEYDIVRRTSMGGPIRRVFAAVNWRKLRREERLAWRAVDGCSVTSSRDEALLREQEPGVQTCVVPNGVDVDYFRPDGGTALTPRTVLFFGAHNYYPNADGIRYFLGEIFPLLRAHGARLKIVGPASPWVFDLASHDVEVTGFVDDVRPHLAGASVVVAPLRIGGGTRLKILEAMAMSKAVVSTSIGAEGLAVTHGKDILLADTPQSFAEAIRRLFDDPGLATSLGRGARALVEGEYAWSAAARSMAGFIDDLRRRGASSQVTRPQAVAARSL